MSLKEVVEVLRVFSCLISRESEKDTDVPPHIDLRLNLDSMYNLHFRMTNFNGKYNTIVTLTKSGEEGIFKMKAARAEYMTLLINSLSHELATPLTEILQITETGGGGGFKASRTLLNPSIIQISSLDPLTNQNTVSQVTFEGVIGSPSGPKRSDTGSSTGPRILSRVAQITRRLSMFLSSLMTYSQILNGQFELDMENKFSVREMLLELSGFYKDRCEQRNLSIEVECQDSFTIRTDRKRLQCVIFSFIDNAIKFSNKPNSIIKIVVDITHSTNTMVFKIIDNGIGISEKDMGVIVRTMKRPFSTENTKSSAGLGIGLRTAQAIISELSRNQGQMSISSKVGFGTTISFELLISTKKPNIAVHSPRDNNNPTLLIQAPTNIKNNTSEGKKAHIEYNRDRNIAAIGSEQVVATPSNTLKVHNSVAPEGIFDKMAMDVMRKVSMNQLNTIILSQQSMIVSQTSIRLGERIKPSATVGETKLNTILGQTESKKVMIVDDEVFLLEFMRELMESWNLDVYTASSPERAIELGLLCAQMKTNIDVVFMDFNMPGMTGPECTRILKEERMRAAFGESVFIAFTAQDDKFVRDKFREVSVSQFIFKPFTFEQVRDMLTSLKVLPKMSLSQTPKS